MEELNALDIETITQNIFQNAQISSKFKVMRSFHYPKENSALMEKTNEQFIVIEVSEGKPTSVYYMGKPYLLKDAYYIYQGDINNALKNTAIQTYSDPDGSSYHLFNI